MNLHLLLLLQGIALVKQFREERAGETQREIRRGNRGGRKEERQRKTTTSKQLALYIYIYTVYTKVKGRGLKRELRLG